MINKGIKSLLKDGTWAVFLLGTLSAPVILAVLAVTAKKESTGQIVDLQRGDSGTVNVSLPSGWEVQSLQDGPDGLFVTTVPVKTIAGSCVKTIQIAATVPRRDVPLIYYVTSQSSGCVTLKTTTTTVIK